jgi:hypothetical protein
MNEIRDEPFRKIISTRKFHWAQFHKLLNNIFAYYPLMLGEAQVLRTKYNSQIEKMLLYHLGEIELQGEMVHYGTCW